MIHCAAIFMMITGCSPVPPHLTQEPEKNSAAHHGSELQDGGADSVRSARPKLSEFNILKANKPTALLLQVDDVIRLIVPDHPELSMPLTVQSDGSISIPSAGELYIGGLTLEETREIIKKHIGINTDTQIVRLQINDEVKLQVWHETELTHVARVQPDGMITFPLAGQVRAVGKTIQELSDTVRIHLSRYLNQPIISLLPIKLQTSLFADVPLYVVPQLLQPRLVTVVGNVRLPGVFQLKGSYTRVFDIMAQSAYISETAQLNSVLVIRNMHENPTYQVLRLKDYLNGKAPDQNIYLLPGDIVFIPKSPIARVGDFVEQFFTRTRPLFDWWLSAVQSYYAVDIAKSTVQFYDLLRQSQKLNTSVMEAVP